MDTTIRPVPRSNDERGALLVEFALLAPILIVMLLGTITVGIGFNRSNSLNNGARESARYGATLPVADDLAGWLNSVADVVASSAALDSGAEGRQICVAYVFPDGSDANDRTMAVIETDGSRTLAENATCFDDGRPSSERRVQVTVERMTYVSTGLYTADITIDARSVARYERA